MLLNTDEFRATFVKQTFLFVFCNCTIWAVYTCHNTGKFNNNIVACAISAYSILRCAMGTIMPYWHIQYMENWTRLLSFVAMCFALAWLACSLLLALPPSVQQQQHGRLRPRLGGCAATVVGWKGKARRASHPSQTKSRQPSHIFSIFWANCLGAFSRCTLTGYSTIFLHFSRCLLTQSSSQFDIWVGN